VALLGHPVAHSVSPAIHNAAFAAVGIDAVYTAFDVAPERIDAAVDAISALGLLGANVTIPHKQAVFLRIPHRSHEAELTGAANTVYWDGDALAADNTDVHGLRSVLDSLGIVDDPVVLVGAGGAARAAAMVLGERGARVEIAARREEAAVQVRAIAAAAGAVCEPVEHPRLVINATSLGLLDESLPSRFMHLEAQQIALDLVYGPRDTPFLAAARAAGATVADGRQMLLAQAAAAFTRWTGAPAPWDVMATAMDRELGKTD
jgi:shikimate dehydrogenase